MEMKNIRILLVDDHAIVRWGMSTLIEKKQGYLVCGEAATLAEAYEKVETLKPEIVLLDLKLPDGDGATGCRQIKKISPNTKIIVLTAFADDLLLLETIKAGADGYLLKNIDSKAILSAIENVAKGESILDPAMIGKVMNVVRGNSEMTEELTSQERNILDLIRLGKTNKEIAEELFIAEKTVRNYVSRIMRKINVSNRTEAAIYWSKQKSLK
ncbi:DNA-binding NarL/FixJ family response regulator [Anaerosolibacter carboniphilus]|uniref:Stage 0 sporulation protein A homolog n=1 Tax=Anaerosolibacter carboniphilus TaxID=1417629 RepID=A0A841KS32_9FIRM|nr:response regulator transcription factor [Anaerosolibacter carboniphilus]MBB6216191.1 DNA-binding NarL/FixJ family response regulator [Anaerosolibacter carboniphilus]